MKQRMRHRVGGVRAPLRLHARCSGVPVKKSRGAGPHSATRGWGCPQRAGHGSDRLSYNVAKRFRRRLSDAGSRRTVVAVVDDLGLIFVVFLANGPDSDAGVITELIAAI